MRNNTTPIRLMLLLAITSTLLSATACSACKKDESNTVLPIDDEMIDIAGASLEGSAQKFTVDLLKEAKAGKIEDIDEKNPDDYDATLLHYAAQIGHPRLLDAVLSHKPNVNARNKVDQTPLHHAVLYNKYHSVERLLKVEGIDVNIATKVNQNTPLHLAADSMECLEIVELLLSHPGIDNQKKNKMGKTALQIAENRYTAETNPVAKERFKKMVDALKSK